jgi:hypothetical protein
MVLIAGVHDYRWRVRAPRWLEFTLSNPTINALHAASHFSASGGVAHSKRLECGNRIVKSKGGLIVVGS